MVDRLIASYFFSLSYWTFRREQKIDVVSSGGTHYFDVPNSSEVNLSVPEHVPVKVRNGADFANLGQAKEARQ